MEGHMENNLPDIPRMSLIAMLRWIAVLEVILGSAGLIIFVAMVQPGQSALSTMALLFTGLKWVLFVSLLLYALSYLDPSVENMKTIFGVSIQKVLRYSITGVLLFSLTELILNVAATAIANGAFIANAITGIISTLAIMAIFYTLYLLVKSKISAAE